MPADVDIELAHAVREIAQLHLEVARLTRERDELKQKVHYLATEIHMDQAQETLTSADKLRQERDALRACVTQLAGALRGLRRSHRICDEDCWYSCPESGECCNEKATGCNCGANEANATIDTALAAAEKFLG